MPTSSSSRLTHVKNASSSSIARSVARGEADRPSRPTPVIDASFMGKFEFMLDEYDALPSLDEEAEAALRCELPEPPFDPDASALRGAPSGELASLAERTRSQLLMLRPSGSAVSESDACSECSESEAEAEPPAPRPAVARIRMSRPSSAAAKASAPGSRARDAAAPSKPSSGTKPPGGGKPSDASMMTHPASMMRAPSQRDHRWGAGGGAGADASRAFGGGGPRCSPSGTMPHHAPPHRALTAASTRPASARPSTRPASAGSARSNPADENAPASNSNASTPRSTTAAKGEATTTKGGSITTPRTAVRPSSARSSRSSASSSHEVTGGYEPAAFGADTKGCVPFRKPEARTRSRLADCGAEKPFAFVVECCGEAYDGYCCRRHHPSDDVVCCEKHDPHAQPKVCPKSAMGGKVGAGRGPNYTIPKGSRHTAISGVPRGHARPREARLRPSFFL